MRVAGIDFGAASCSATSCLPRFAADDTGATAVEYSLIAALICVAMITGMSAFADETNGMWVFVRTNILNAMAG